MRSLPLDPCWDEPSQRVQELISTAERWEDAFLSRRALSPVLSFHASNFRMVSHALRDIVAQDWCPASGKLLEWGSGLGVVGCMWALQGGVAVGIEADEELAQLSNKLARRFELDARFTCGNFMPNRAWNLVDTLDETTRLVRNGADGYESLGVELEEVDIVFVYPWPGERRLIDDVFDHCAGSGALLLSFHGGDELRLQCKA